MIDPPPAAAGPVHLPNLYPTLPFSAAVRIGPWVMLSGEIGVMANGRLAGGLQAQTLQALENVEATLGRLGGDRSHIVKCLVMLRRMEMWSAFNGAYQAFFRGHPLPVRSAFGASALALDAEVELECLAFLPPAA